MAESANLTYYQGSKEEIAARTKEYYRKYKDEIRQKAREKYQNLPEEKKSEKLESCRIKQRNMTEEDRAKRRAYKRSWYSKRLHKKHISYCEKKKVIKIKAFKYYSSLLFIIVRYLFLCNLLFYSFS